MTIYVDIVLLENILMNYIILIATGILVNKKIKFIKILLSSTIGGIYSIFNYCINNYTILNIVMKILISLIMVRISYNNRNLKSFIKQLLFFYLVSLTFGGIVFMFCFFINSNIIKILCISVMFLLSLLVILKEVIKSKMENQICEIEIYYDGKDAKIKSFIDSGNLLKDPISMFDVIVVEKDSLRDIVSYAFLDSVDRILNGNMISDGNDFIKNKIRIIPFSSLGNENGILIGFRPDYIKIYSDDVKMVKNVIVGIYNGKLTKSNLYTSLIGLNILKESDFNEQIINNA